MPRVNLKNPSPLINSAFRFTHLLLLLAIFLTGCQNEAKTAGRPLPPVTVEQLELSERPHWLETTGMVEPWQESRLSFQVAGKIQWGPLEEGQRVSPGTVLARLDDSVYQVQADAAARQLKLAEVDLDRTRSDMERGKKLFNTGVISQREYDDSIYAFRAAEAKTEQASSLLTQARLSVEYSVLTAPFAGTVMKKLGQQGEMVAAGTPVLLLAQLSPVKVTFNVPADQVDSWKEGSEAKISPTGGASALGNNGALEIKAVVHNISPGAEGYTGSFRVELQVDNQAQDIRPGQTVKVLRQVSTKKGLWVPLKAVVSRGEDLKYVFVLQPDGQTAKQQEVKLGAVSGDRVEVAQGLEPGDNVLVLMPEDLRDGQQVEVRPSGNN